MRLSRSVNDGRIQIRFIDLLKPPFKFSADIRHVSARGAGSATAKPATTGRWELGDGDMARFEMNGIDCASLGGAAPTAETFYELGMMYSVGRDVPIDFVTAHKWFNVAALRGNTEASRLRREIAEQMSEQEIALAQRAARAWLKAG